MGRIAGRACSGAGGSVAWPELRVPLVSLLILASWVLGLGKSSLPLHDIQYWVMNVYQVPPGMQTLCTQTCTNKNMDSEELSR